MIAISSSFHFKRMRDNSEENCEISVQRCNQKVTDLFVYRLVVTSRNFRG